MLVGSRRSFARLAYGICGLLLACAKPVSEAAPAAPRPPVVEGFRAAPGVTLEARVLPAPGSEDVVGGLALCGPGLIWAATPTEVLALTEGITFPLLRHDEGQSRRATGLVCPAGGGLVVALTDGVLAFSAKGLPFRATATVDVPFRVPRLTPGVGDELWIWSETPGELLHVQGSRASSVVKREVLVAVAGAAVDAAVIVTRAPSASAGGNVVELVQTNVTEQGDRAAVVTPLGAYDVDVVAVAVGAGGRVFIASEDEILEIESPGRLRRMVRGLGGRLLTWGDHVAVLDVKHERLVILRLAPPE